MARTPITMSSIERSAVVYSVTLPGFIIFVLHSQLAVVAARALRHRNKEARGTSGVGRHQTLRSLPLRNCTSSVSPGMRGAATREGDRWQSRRTQAERVTPQGPGGA